MPQPVTLFERMRTLIRRDSLDTPRRKGWVFDSDALRRTEPNNPDPAISDLVREAWRSFAVFENEPFLVKPSIPILFFGDSDRYFSSPLKIVTLGLNPSGAEFPKSNSFLRFPRARNLDVRFQDSTSIKIYLQALNEYFESPPGDPYKTWFSSFEPLLTGLDASYYGSAASAALHTDICAPLATSLTWSKLPPDVQLRLMESGTRLWHSLVEWLAPDLIIASIARSHLSRISFVREGSWRVIHTIHRENPYDVEVSDLRLPGGKTSRLVFGKAANTPFGTVSNEDKRTIGVELRAYVTREMDGAGPSP